MSTPESQRLPSGASAPAPLPVSVEVVASLAREFWNEFSGGQASPAATPPTAPEGAVALASTPAVSPEPSSAVAAGCSLLDPFSEPDWFGAEGHNVDVSDLVSVPGRTFVAGLPGAARNAPPALGLPGASGAELGQGPYYLPTREALEAGSSSSDVPWQLDSAISQADHHAARQAGAMPRNPFGSLAPALPEPRGGPATDPVAAGLSPELVSGVAQTSVPGTIATARRDFPILNELVNGTRLVWLDNAATTQKPQSVIDRLRYFYEHENSNIHRAAHTLAARSTDAYEGARSIISRFINAGSADNIVFVRGATEAINLVAQAWGRKYVKSGDEIVITWLEHHSNIVPWQLLAAETGAKLLVVPVDSRGQVSLRDYERLLGPRTKLVALTHVSNALGTVVPVEEMAASAHRYGAKVLVDGAQSISHMPVDVRRMDADFFALSGHKVFAPTGIGVLYGKPEVLDSMPPWQGGGNMIADVTFERTVYMPPPMRFEAGTGNIADAIGLGAAFEYLERIGMANVAAHERELIEYTTSGLLQIPGVRIIGTAAEKAGVVSFVLANRSVPEIGAALAAAGVAVRAGHHCAQPALRRFGLEATVRPSFALYNNHDDIDALLAVLKNLAQSF
jgi:cysteine desulfurase / selenocysteine lyase